MKIFTLSKQSKPKPFVKSALLGWGGLGEGGGYIRVDEWEYWSNLMLVS